MSREHLGFDKNGTASGPSIHSHNLIDMLGPIFRFEISHELIFENFHAPWECKYNVTIRAFFNNITSGTFTPVGPNLAPVVYCIRLKDQLGPAALIIIFLYGFDLSSERPLILQNHVETEKRGHNDTL